LIGLLQPTHGEVRFGGRNIQHDVLAYRRHLGYVPEEPNLYPHLTGWEYLEMVGTLREISETSAFQSHSPLIVMGYFFGAIILATYIPEYEARITAIPAATPLLLVPLALILLGLFHYRKNLLPMDKELIFEEPQNH